MKKCKLLDCTLREVSLHDHGFGNGFIIDFIRQMTNAGVDLIEIGFLKTEEYRTGSTLFSKVEQIDYILKKVSGHCKCVALIDHGRFDVSSLPEASETSLYGVRVCFKKNQITEVLTDVEILVKKGYRVFVQHVDIMSYSDNEICSFIDRLNERKVTGYSIVDTFGAMYMDDIERIFKLVDNKLDDGIVIGIHAHNNKMIANALTMKASEIVCNRDIVLDATILGAGRGAGNANTEILMDYLSKKHGKHYHPEYLMNVVDKLEVIVKDRFSWGYRFPFFLAGVHDAHVFIIDYLLTHHNIASNDIDQLLSAMSEDEKKRYNYSYLDRLMIEEADRKVDDKEALYNLKEMIGDKKIIAVGPGTSIKEYYERINNYHASGDYVVFTINHINDDLEIDGIFISHITRYIQLKDRLTAADHCYITSNIINDTGQCNTVAYNMLIKAGWVNFDNSLILFLRLLLRIGVAEVVLAGFDGFTENEENDYINKEYCTGKCDKEIELLNREIAEMIEDVEKEGIKVSFLTPSIYKR